MDQLDQQPPVEPPNDERRDHPRIEMLGRLRGALEPLHVPAVVRDISVGGFAIETPFSFEPGTRHDFRLVLSNGEWSRAFSANVVRSLRVSSVSGEPRFVTGFEFINQDSPEEQAALEETIESLIPTHRA